MKIQLLLTFLALALPLSAFSITVDELKSCINTPEISENMINTKSILRSNNYTSYKATSELKVLITAANDCQNLETNALLLMGEDNSQKPSKKVTAITAANAFKILSDLTVRDLATRVTSMRDEMIGTN